MALQVHLGVYRFVSHYTSALGVLAARWLSNADQSQYPVPHPSQNQIVCLFPKPNEQLLMIADYPACRQCEKDFNPLWRRSHTCGHCGYEYCSTCLSDGQALMPRRAGQGSLNKGPLAEIRQGLGLDSSSSGSGSGSGNNGSGYEVESVCVPCLSMLQGGSFYPHHRSQRGIPDSRAGKMADMCSDLRTS